MPSKVGQYLVSPEGEKKYVLADEVQGYLNQGYVFLPGTTEVGRFGEGLPLTSVTPEQIAAEKVRSQAEFTEATPEELAGEYSKRRVESYYDTAPQKIKAVAEGVGGALTFGGSDWLLKELGADVSGRAEGLPGYRTAGEIAGIVGGSILPGGQSALGRLLARAPAGALSKVASKAGTYGALTAEGTAYGLGGAFSQIVLDDDIDLASEEALNLLGTNALLGGAFGFGGKAASDALGKFAGKYRDKATKIAHNESVNHLSEPASRIIKQTDNLVNSLTNPVPDIAAHEETVEKTFRYIADNMAVPEGPNIFKHVEPAVPVPKAPAKTELKEIKTIENGKVVSKFQRYELTPSQRSSELKRFALEKKAYDKAVKEANKANAKALFESEKATSDFQKLQENYSNYISNGRSSWKGASKFYDELNRYATAVDIRVPPESRLTERVTKLPSGSKPTTLPKDLLAAKNRVQEFFGTADITPDHITKVLIDQPDSGKVIGALKAVEDYTTTAKKYLSPEQGLKLDKSIADSVPKVDTSAVTPELLKAALGVGAISQIPDFEGPWDNFIKAYAVLRIGGPSAVKIGKEIPILGGVLRRVGSAVGARAGLKAVGESSSIALKYGAMAAGGSLGWTGGRHFSEMLVNGAAGLKSGMAQRTARIASVAEKLARGVKASRIPAQDLVSRALFGEDENKSYSSRHEAYKEKVKQISNVVGNSPSYGKKVHDSLKEVWDVFPRLADEIEWKTLEIPKFLHAAMTRDPGDITKLGISTWNPTDLDIHRGNEYLRGIFDPIGVFEDVLAGKASAQAGIAMRKFNPGTVTQMQLKIFENAEEIVKNATYDQLTALQVVTGIALHPTLRPKYIEYMQTRHAERTQEQEQNREGAGSSSTSSSPPEPMTRAQELSGR